MTEHRVSDCSEAAVVPGWTLNPLVALSLRLAGTTLNLLLRWTQVLSGLNQKAHHL